MRDLASDLHDGHICSFFTTYARIVSASTYRRADMPRRSSPLKEARLVDGRIPLATRVAKFEEVGRCKPCCRGTVIDRLFGPSSAWPTPRGHTFSEWERILMGWCHVLQKTASIASLGRQNRQTKTVVTNAQMRYPSIVASCLLRDAQSTVERAAVIERSRLEQIARPELPALGPPPTKPKRAISPKEPYLVVCFQAERSNDNPMNVLGFRAAGADR